MNATNNRTIIICTSPKGSAISNYFYKIAEAFNSRGYKVLMVLDKNHKQSPKDTNLTFFTWPSYRPTNFKDFLFFYKLCKQMKPEIVLGQFGSSNVVLIISRLLNIPNRWVYWHTMFRQLDIDSKKNKIIKNLLRYRKGIIMNVCTTHIFTNSSATKKDLIKIFKVKTYKISVIHYLISDYFAHQKQKSREQRNHAVAFVGRIDKSKGHIDVIKQIPEILNVYHDLKFYFIGEGTERKVLQKLCKTLGIEKNVIFTGSVPLNKVYEYLSEVLIHISASKEEAFGLVNAEALSTGTPIIANKVGGIADILLPNYNGVFFEPTLNGSLLIAIQQILNDDWLVYSTNARNSFLNRYDDSIQNVNKQITSYESSMK